MPDDDIAAEWDAQAVRFDDEPDHGLGDPAVRAAWLELMTSVLPAAPARVADLGCGTGTLSALLAERGHVVRGVDLSPAMIRRAEAKSASVEPRPSFVCADAAAPPLEVGTFDVVLCRHVLWALPDPVAALHRWVELLVPGGRLVLIEGRWSTGAGLTAEQVERLVGAVATVTSLRHLPEPALWGKEIDDERFVLVAQA